MQHFDTLFHAIQQYTNIATFIPEKIAFLPFFVRNMFKTKLIKTILNLMLEMTKNANEKLSFKM